jgi:hypothetical protein
MPMIATTIISSISVKPWTFFMESPWVGQCKVANARCLYATVMPPVECIGAALEWLSKAFPEQDLASTPRNEDQR